MSNVLRFLRVLRYFGGNDIGIIRYILKSRIGLVFAHQADDIIFFLPFCTIAEKNVVVAYPGSSWLRRIVRAYPRWYQKSWFPLLGETNHYEAKKIAHIDSFKINDFLFQQTFMGKSIKNLLIDQIAPLDVVVTHNPWGEYGHHQHKELNKCLVEVCQELSKDLWVLSGKVDWDMMKWIQNPDLPVLNYHDKINAKINKSLYFKLRRKYFDIEREYITEKTDPSYFLGEIDITGRFWTWDRQMPDSTFSCNGNYAPPSLLPPDHLFFIRVIKQGAICNHLDMP